MAFLPCQEDPDLRVLESPVVDCRRGEDGWWVVLERSPFYPGGGGQPADRGWIDGQPVREIRRGDGGMPVHRLDRPVAGTVRAEVDREWRFDVSCQHTAQHLVTATALSLLGWRTVAFHLGPERCDIEMEPKELPPEDLDRLRQEVNARIREARPVRVLQAASREEMAARSVRSRRLPEGIRGPIRLVEIEGVDLNTCGGTHVRNTAELQGIHFTGTERIARGTRLFFLAGGRLFREIDRALDRDRRLTALLTCGREEHEAAVAKMRDQRDALDRELRETRRRLAAALARDLGARPEGPVTWCSPRDDMDFLREVAEAVRRVREDRPVALVGAEGAVLFAGPDPVVRPWFQEAQRRAGIRGGGRQGTYQGKGDPDRSPEEWGRLLGESFPDPVSR